MVTAKVRGSGNASTELRLIAVFRAQGLTGWRRKPPLVGKPDFVFPAQRVALFVDGCFWHGCPIHATQPKQNAECWQANEVRQHGDGRAKSAALQHSERVSVAGCPQGRIRSQIERNKARDRLVTQTLKAKGWRVLRIWGHELKRKNEKRLLAQLKRVGLL